MELLAICLLISAGSSSLWSLVLVKAMPYFGYSASWSGSFCKLGLVLFFLSLGMLTLLKHRSLDGDYQTDSASLPSS